MLASWTTIPMLDLRPFVHLPNAFDADHVSAVLADGVLTLRIPKLPRAKPRRISLGSAGQEKQLGEKKE